MSGRGDIGTCTRRGGGGGTTNDNRTTTSVLRKQNSTKRSTAAAEGNRSIKAKCTTCSFNRSESSAIKYLKILGGKMAAALRMISPKKSRRGRSRKVTSSESNAKQQQQQTTTPPPAAVDSHRAEAIDDCIQFINSSSLPRSNSVSCHG